MIGGVNQRDQAARVHRVADDGGDMNHRQNRLLKVPRLAMPSAYLTNVRLPPKTDTRLAVDLVFCHLTSCCI